MSESRRGDIDERRLSLQCSGEMDGERSLLCGVEQLLKAASVHA